MKHWQNLCLALTLGYLGLNLSACREVPQQPQTGSSPTMHAETQTDAQFIQMLADLKNKNPEQDAQAAILRGERYLLCNAGRSRTVPGLTPEVYASISHRCPTQCLDGVTDALMGSHHAAYLGAALDYSATWNQVMAAACR